MNETHPFTISRIFDAPLDRVWEAWTDESQLKTWFGPKGCPIKFAKLDFKVGGHFHYCMETPINLDMWGKWTYRKIEPKSQLQWTHTFSDAAGINITRHPFSPTWPLEMVLTIVLEDIGNNQTNLTLTLIAVNVSDIERATWDSGFAGLTQGWGGTFDVLDEFLKS